MFGISVSGIKNAQKHLDVTSNNIANANSYGFKKSRAEFADIYSSSLFANSKTTAGMGVQNTCVSQQFAQGNLSGDTGNTLDMAIQGNGFFVLSQSLTAGAASLTYTRNGAFQVNEDGYIVTAMGDYVQGWDVNENGSSTSLDLNSTHAIQIPSDTGAPKPSENIGIGVNLPAGIDPVNVPSLGKTDPFFPADVGTEDGAWASGINGPDGTPESWDASMGIPRNIEDGTIVEDGLNSDDPNVIMQYLSNFDPKNSDTYTCSTSQTIHDSLGNAHTLTYYMLKMGNTPGDETQSVWTVLPFVDGQPVDVAANESGNPAMISVTGGNSSIYGANLFGFQMKFGTDGELASIVPSNVQLLNPNSAGDFGETSLRNILFGAPNDPESPGNVEGYVDLTFENDTANTKESLFDGDGSLHTAIGVGVDPSQQINIDFTKATQYGSSTFNVSTAPWNDGYATGVLLGVEVNEDGVLQCEYSNGRLVNIAKLAMADFTNVQGLTKVGDTQWKQSLASGEAIAKEANEGSAGKIIGSNLELSNVDLTTELVELISAQRNYQANSQALQTQTTVMDAILNIR